MTDLLSVLRCQVLSVLQFAVPAWTTMISQAESRSIEAVQKTGLYLIYGQRYESYNWALKEANMKTQSEQRSAIFKKFTKSCLKSPKFSKWFCKAEASQGLSTRSRKMRFKPVPFRTQAYAKSPIPQMVKLANQMANNEGGGLKFKSGKIIIL